MSIVIAREKAPTVAAPWNARSASTAGKERARAPGRTARSR
jgi:hypothetical protein